MTDLRLLQFRAWKCSEEHGFHDIAGITFGDRIALIHSEASEALEAYRETHGFEKWHREDGKPEGVGPELADVVIRCLDLAEILGIDLTADVLEKMAYNEGRPHLHGGKAL